MTMIRRLFVKTGILIPFLLFIVVFPEVVFSESSEIEGFQGADATMSPNSSTDEDKAEAKGSLSGWVGGKILKKELRKMMEGDLDVQVKSLTGLEFQEGKPYQVEIHGKQVVIQSFLPLTALDVMTDNAMPLVIDTKKKPPLQRPVQAQISLVFSEEDLKQLFQSEKAKRLLTHIKVPVKNETTGSMEDSFWDVMDPTVQMTADHVLFDAKILPSGESLEKAIQIHFETRVFYDPVQYAMTLDQMKMTLNGQEVPESLLNMVQEGFHKMVNLTNHPMGDHQLSLQFSPPEFQEKQARLTAKVTVTPLTETARKTNAKPE